MRDVAQRCDRLRRGRRQVTASTALPNSTSAPSPMSLNVRPECAAISESKMSRLMAFKRASVRPRRYPCGARKATTSADTIAASLRGGAVQARENAPWENAHLIRLYGSLGKGVHSRRRDGAALGQSRPRLPALAPPDVRYASISNQSCAAPRFVATGQTRKWRQVDGLAKKGAARTGVMGVTALCQRRANS